MPWLILFITSWVLLIILIKWKDFGINMLAGFFAMLLQYAIDSQAINHEFYKINQKIVSVDCSSLFFIIGPVFVIGTLFAQYHPRKRIMIVINVILLAIFFSLQEILLLNIGALEYTNWHFTDSIVVNISAMIIISWFSIIILSKRKGEIE